MSGIFSNQSALSFNRERDAAEEALFPQGRWRAEAEVSSAFYHEWEAKRPADASEVGFAESSYEFLRDLLAPVFDEDGICRNVEDALILLRAVYRTTPEWREVLTRMGQWLHTVSEFG